MCEEMIDEICLRSMYGSFYVRDQKDTTGGLELVVYKDTMRSAFFFISS